MEYRYGPLEDLGLHLRAIALEYVRCDLCTWSGSLSMVAQNLLVSKQVYSKLHVLFPSRLYICDIRRFLTVENFVYGGADSPSIQRSVFQFKSIIGLKML